MENLVTFALTVFTGFFAISNPIANTPIFLGLVDGKDAQTKKNIAKKGTVVAFIIVTVFVLLGKYIFELFDITIPAFKIAGGILIFYVGFEMLMSQKSKVQTNNTEDDSNNLAVSPLAIPIISGPGTIVTAMNFTTNATYTHIAIVILMFALIIFLNYICFSLSNKIVQLVGPNLITVLGKIMGLILAIIGTGMLIAGIKIAFNL
jgi:multiple antibiotic resistance protein